MLRTDALTARLPRAFVSAQRVSKPADSGPQARILALQRTAGNRAVAEMLGRQSGPQVQRDISVRPGQLSPHERLLSGTGGTYGKIINVLRGFHRATDPKKRLELADALRGLSVTWMTNHGSPKGRREASQHALIELLEAEASREASKLRAEAIYLASFPGQGAGGGQAGAQTLTGIKPMLTMAYADPAIAMKAGKSTGGTTGTGAQAQELAAEYKLSAAEVAAIRTFTLPDYAYINPAVANSDSWLSSNLAGSKDPYMEQFKPRPMVGSLGPEFNALKLEGAFHAGMLSQAVSKLPAYKEVTYRGTRETPGDIKSKFREGAQLPPYTAFSSASKRRSKAQGFADGEAGNFTPPKEKTASVVFVIVMTNGRDISKLSAMGDEEEVLILPGARFQVDRVVQMPKGKPGKPAATDWYTVFLTQIA